MKTKFRMIATYTIVLTLSSLLSPLPGHASYNQGTAQNYLLAHSNSPWATMGLAALGTPNIPSDHLKNISGEKAIDYEAPILAISSINQNPRTFGTTNLIDKLKTFYSGGQIGDATALNDDTFGILALFSAGVPSGDAVIADSKSFLLAHQNADGGWGYTTDSGSDSNSTAITIVALITAGVPASDSHIQTAIDYLKAFQNPDGGFYQMGTESDSSSTAWVMWALTAAGISPATWTKSGHGPADYLADNQTAAGLFEYQGGSGEDSFSPVTTAYAVMALAGKTLPIKSISVSVPSVNFRIEGSSSAVCSGTVNASNALDVVKAAADNCGFTYDIQQKSFGPYLNQINSDTAAGLKGWIYLVNDTYPSVGAADYQTKSGDSVLWYFGDYGLEPLKLSMSADTASSGQSATATVEAHGDSGFAPLAGATVYFGTNSATTNNSGKANINGADGYYKIYGQKTGFIRSNSSLLKIGQPSTSSLALTANFSGGQVNGTTTPEQEILSFTVDSSSLDFGNVAAGTQKTKNLTVHNTGSSALKLSASVSGDPLFTSNLSLNNSFWQSFSASIATSQSQTLAATLKIPAAFTSASGNKSGQMILWASAQ